MPPRKRGPKYTRGAKRRPEPDGIECVLYRSRADAMEAGGGSIQPGAMWPDPDLLDSEYWRTRGLSAQYLADYTRTRRVPIRVMLPDRTEFVVDSAYSGGDGDRNPDRQGWTVTGEAPRLTLSPSIHIRHGKRGGGWETSWHGFLRNGILTGV